MKKGFFFLFAIAILFLGYGCQQNSNESFEQEPLAQWIDPMIGTAGHAHT